MKMWTWFWPVTAVGFGLVLFQNCGGEFRAFSEREIESQGGPALDVIDEVGNPALPGPNLLPAVGALKWSVEFDSPTDVLENFDIYGGDEAYRQTIGEQRDLFHEEGYFTRPEAGLEVATAGGQGTLRILSQPTIAVDSGKTAAQCGQEILNLRRWGRDDNGVTVGEPLAINPDGFKLQVFDALQAPGGDTAFWDALDDCRLYTGRIASKQKFGPGSRIQARINMSDVHRTGYIYMFRLSSPGAYDNNPATGVDVSLAEFGWGKFSSPERTAPQSLFNTALRYNYEVAPFDGALSFLTDTSQVEQGMYRLSQTWNPKLLSTMNDGLYDMSWPDRLPEAFDVMDGWYVFTVDWRADRMDFYIQKESVASPPFRYLTVTDSRMISQSCDQEIWLANNVSQTFAETKTGTVWDYVQAAEMDPQIATIESRRYPQGRDYRTYRADAMQVDWVRVFDIPGGSGTVSCPN